MGYYNYAGNLELAYKTPTTWQQANKRLTKMGGKIAGFAPPADGSDQWRRTDYTLFIVHRDISDWGPG